MNDESGGPYQHPRRLPITLSVVLVVITMEHHHDVVVVVVVSVNDHPFLR